MGGSRKVRTKTGSVSASNKLRRWRGFINSALAFTCSLTCFTRLSLAESGMPSHKKPSDQPASTSLKLAWPK